MEMVVEVNGVKITYAVKDVDEAAALTAKLTSMNGPKKSAEAIEGRWLKFDPMADADPASAMGKIQARVRANEHTKTENVLALLRRVQEAGLDGIRGGILMRDVHANGPAMKLLIEHIEVLAERAGLAPASVVVRKRLASGTTWYPGPNIARALGAFGKEVTA